MAQVINTNSLSLITQNNINKNQSSMSTAIERLSSGLRINSAKDDAAGQAIANRFTANIKGLMVFLLLRPRKAHCLKSTITYNVSVSLQFKLLTVQILIAIYHQSRRK